MAKRHMNQRTHTNSFLFLLCVNKAWFIYLFSPVIIGLLYYIGQSLVVSYEVGYVSATCVWLLPMVI